MPEPEPNSGWEPSPLFGVMWRELNKGRVIPFLGAGASLIAPANPAPLQPGAPPPWKFGLPTGSELRTYLAKMSSIDLAKFGSVELAAIAQYITYKMSRRALDDLLHDIFVVDYGVGKIHRLLAAIPDPLLVMTTNYDDMLECAFEKADPPKEFDLVIHQIADEEHAGSVLFAEHGKPARFVPPNSLEINLGKRSVIYKMHGTVAKDQSLTESFVITEDDYVDFLTRMGSNTPIPAMIREAFKGRSFLFLGYGLADWNFRVMLGSLRKELNESKSTAIIWQGPPLELEIWRSRGVECYDMTVDQFVDGIKTTK